jgi:DNA replication protein DnaC
MLRYTTIFAINPCILYSSATALQVLYRRAPRLFADLATARGEGRLTRLMRSLERTRLLIIDDWGTSLLALRIA